jgi:FAD/FMN-containing dehydrogenase
MKRKLKWTAVVLAVVLLGFGAALFLWPRDRITAESWKKIQIGMTEKEVEGILGGPGMNEQTAQLRLAQLQEQLGKPPEIGTPLEEGEVSERSKAWFGRRGIIEIYFDNNREVTWKFFTEIQPADPNVIDRLRDWLGW